ncbi:valine--tRNA ligase [Candidatus Pacearchaeota archaeon]|nr:valine--tRNA ligase [Candidatus Pacearchaeota archaeon]
MLELSQIKNWNIEIEKEITSNWKAAELFTFNPKTKKKIYSIDTPPPYVNTPIHMGHATTYCYMDFFARYKRLKGFEVIFPLGLDRNGLPIEMAAEKKFKVSPFEVGREKFVEFCKKILEESSAGSIDSFARLGISFTSYKMGGEIGALYHTDSPEYRRLTQTTFTELYKKGLIYEDTRINNWDPKLQTTIADSEIDYEEIPSTFNYIKWKVKETKEEILIGTTRPELIATCGMVIFNPEDERYKHLEGKTAISPIFENEIPIKSHPFAKIDKGTGVVMMCSMGDVTDIQFFREMNLTPKIAINKDGKMNANAGILEGLKVKEARGKIIELVKEKGLLEKQEKITHRTPISERSKVEMEFIEMPEFYLKQLDFKDKIKEVSNQITFYPNESKKILDDWIDKISIDWPISRRRYYATSVPLWYSGEMVAIAPSMTYVEPFKESPPENSEVLNIKTKKTMGKVKDFPGVKWIGEERVLDTWFDSSISELVMLKYKSDDSFFQKSYPATLRPQGKEIVRTWLYYTVLRGFLETNKAPFKDAWIHQHILDDKGKKMSKSLGNVIDPQDVLEDEGAEALRLWAATEGDISKGDLSCSRERIKGEKKTINKLLNISKFVMLFEKPKEEPALTNLDKLFIDYIENITEETDKAYEIYDFNTPSLSLRKFLWDTFASNYIELIKNRAYNQQNNFTKEESSSAKYTLHFLLERLLLLLYPIIPQSTTTIAGIKGINLLKSEWPSAKKTKSNLSLIDSIIDFNSKVWKTKKEKGISLKDPLEGISIPRELSPFEKDLKACHSI